MFNIFIFKNILIYISSSKFITKEKKYNGISKMFLEEKKKEEKELNKEKFMKDLELKTEKKVMEGFISKQISNPLLKKNESNLKQEQDVLQSILANSSNEFKEKMGRNMSYSEMRQLYG
jgi:hypothetical protein